MNMSGLKSAWELSLERSDKLAPELKNQKKLTKKQKQEIAEIRNDYAARIADKDVTFQDKIRKLSDRIPPDEIVGGLCHASVSQAAPESRRCSAPP